MLLNDSPNIIISLHVIVHIAHLILASVKMFGFVVNENKTHTVYVDENSRGCGDSYSVHLNVMHIGVKIYWSCSVFVD